MRVAAAIVVLACTGWAQFKSNVPLVVAPATVTDSKGRYIDGLTVEDLTLYDNSVPQAIQMDWMMYPISLVVAVETSANSGAVIDKLGGSGILFTQLLAADAGETAVISFSDRVKVLQEFTVRAKTAEDLKPEAERVKVRQCPLCRSPDDTPVPPDLGPGGLMYGIGELIHMRQPDLSRLFTNITGGRALGFLKKNALAQAIQLVSEEAHRQYILSFEPKGGEPGTFHAIRVAVKNRPELQVKTREGYWALQ